MKGARFGFGEAFQDVKSMSYDGKMSSRSCFSLLFLWLIQIASWLREEVLPGSHIHHPARFAETWADAVEQRGFFRSCLFVSQVNLQEAGEVEQAARSELLSSAKMDTAHGKCSCRVTWHTLGKGRL